MDETIGKYIQKHLRFNSISNKKAGEAIGLSESAFEKILMKDDILLSRLLKLSEYTGINFFEYFFEKDPLLAFRKNENEKFTEQINNLNQSIKILKEQINDKCQIIELQNRLIENLQEKLNNE